MTKPSAIPDSNSKNASSPIVGTPPIITDSSFPRARSADLSQRRNSDEIEIEIQTTNSPSNSEQKTDQRSSAQYENNDDIQIPISDDTETDWSFDPQENTTQLSPEQYEKVASCLDTIVNTTMKLGSSLKGYAVDSKGMVVPAVVFGLIGLTSWFCNKEAVASIFNFFKDNSESYDSETVDELVNAIQALLTLSAEIGGGLGNLVLNFMGTMALLDRFKTMKKAYEDKSAFRHSYTFIALCALLSSSSNGFMVALSAETKPKAIFDFIINTAAAMGPHALFSLQFVSEAVYSVLGDLAAKLSKKEKYVDSANTGILTRYVKTVSYLLSSLTTEDQVNLMFKVYRKLNWEIPVDTYDLEAQAFTVKDLNGFTADFTKKSLDERMQFYLLAGQEQKIPFESTGRGLAITLANTAALLFSIPSSLANMTNINETLSKVFSPLPEDVAGILANGLSPFGYMIKIMMYYGSLKVLIEKLHFAKEIFTWFRSSSVSAQLLLGALVPLVTALGVTSGACYANDALGLFPMILDGYLESFLTGLASLLGLSGLFGNQHNFLGTAGMCIVSYLGAGGVNACGLMNKSIELLLSFVYLINKEQEARDKIGTIGLSTVQTFLNAAPDSKEVLAVKDMFDQFLNGRIDYQPVSTSDDLSSSNQEIEQEIEIEIEPQPSSSSVLPKETSFAGKVSQCFFGLLNCGVNKTAAVSPNPDDSIYHAIV